MNDIFKTLSDPIFVNPSPRLTKSINLGESEIVAGVHITDDFGTKVSRPDLPTQAKAELNSPGDSPAIINDEIWDESKQRINPKFTPSLIDFVTRFEADQNSDSASVIKDKLATAIVDKLAETNPALAESRIGTLPFPGTVTRQDAEKLASGEFGVEFDANKYLIVVDLLKEILNLENSVKVQKALDNFFISYQANLMAAKSSNEVFE